MKKTTLLLAIFSILALFLASCSSEKDMPAQEIQKIESAPTESASSIDSSILDVESEQQELSDSEIEDIDSALADLETI